MRVLFWMFLSGCYFRAPLDAALSLVSLSGQEYVFPHQKQLLFIGSSKKSYDQLQNWFSAVKIHSKAFSQYNIIAIPLIEGFLSTSFFKSGCRALLVPMIPEHHLHRVILIFESSEGYEFFHSFQKDPIDELSIVVLHGSKMPVWQTTGDASADKLNSLFQVVLQ